MIHVADTFRDEPAEPGIETLLGGDEGASIVDSLFAMPDETELEAEAGAVGRAMHDRLQTRLAAKMRRLIERVEDREIGADRQDAA